MDDLLAFAAKVDKLGDDYSAAARGSVSRLTLKVHATLVRDTPVDTGLARSNWRVGVGAAPQGVISPYSPGKRLGKRERANADAAIAAARSVVLKRPRGKAGDDDIYIVNNVGYIEALNAGGSKQTPAHFIDQALLIGATNFSFNLNRVDVPVE